MSLYKDRSRHTVWLKNMAVRRHQKRGKMTKFGNSIFRLPQGELLWSPFVRRASSGVRQLLLLSNQWVNWDETSQKASSQWPHQISFILWDPRRIMVSMATKGKKLQNSSSPKLVGRFSNNVVEMFLRWPSIRFLQAMLIGQKTWPPGGGRGYFALYGYSENLKNLILRKCLADFQIIL